MERPARPEFVQITSESGFQPRARVRRAEPIDLIRVDQAEFPRRCKDSRVKRA
jgi:epoxyqueuosine reductase QueG